MWITNVWYFLETKETNCENRLGLPFRLYTFNLIIEGLHIMTMPASNSFKPAAFGRNSWMAFLVMVFGGRNLKGEVYVVHQSWYRSSLSITGTAKECECRCRCEEKVIGWLNMIQECLYRHLMKESSSMLLPQAYDFIVPGRPLSFRTSTTGSSACTRRRISASETLQVWAF